MISSIDQLIKYPEQFGIARNMLVSLRGDASYQQLPYLDLRAQYPSTANSFNSPDAVIEVNGRPSLYLVAKENVDIIQLNEVLACRADARYFAVVEPGILKIYPIGFFEQGQDLKAIETIAIEHPTIALHQFLIGSISPTNKKTHDKAEATWLDNYLFKLLKATAEALHKSGIDDGNVLSLVGRGLFARFIIDREIIASRDIPCITSHANTFNALFSTADAAADTFAWMDKTFNGNMLLLVEGGETSQDYQAFFNNIGRAAADTICRELGNILQGTLEGQVQLGWQRIRFEHVPADMLSQVYEHFTHAYQEEFAKNTSIHYTPRHIAQILVDSAFDGLQLEALQLTDKSHAKVLDPAVGAGVFLVLAFKRLVQERWHATGKRPQREEIRAILNTQLCGFDINPESLKFAALSLYLTALELDPNPEPLDKLVFEELNNTVLFDVKQTSGELGSLSGSLPQRFCSQFDMVVGNPPWTQKGKHATQYTQLVIRIALANGIPDAVANELQVNGGTPDIPFLWRALEWTKPNGMIAYALDAQHFLFRQGKGAEMRSALLKCVELTGVVNGSAMRREKAVWPNITAPFCLVVGRNNKPQVRSAFHYLSPHVEKSINSQGEFRLDPQAAMAVSQRVAQQSPYLFKALFRGTWLDNDIVNRLMVHPSVISLQDYLVSGRGFELGEKEEKRKYFPLIDYLKKFKKLEHSDMMNQEIYLLNVDGLSEFQYSKLYRACAKEIFTGPLVLIRQSPKPERRYQAGVLVLSNLAYSRLFFGYSCAHHQNSQLVARYIQLVSCSQIFSYIPLLISSQYGSERETLLKEDIDQFPIIPFEALTDEQRFKLAELSSRLIDGQKPWTEIDSFVAELYGLNAADMQVIQDTLATQLPYSKTRLFAEALPEKETLASFVEELVRIVQPFAERIGLSIAGYYESRSDNKEWRFIYVSFAGEISQTPSSIQPFIASLADQFWASQIRVQLDHEGYELQIAQLAQNRYWTKTRARLLALDLINDELDKLCKRKVGVH